MPTQRAQARSPTERTPYRFGDDADAVRVCSQSVDERPDLARGETRFGELE